MMAPVVILGGIYTGFFTPTEAAVVAIFYTLFVGVFIHRELKWNGCAKSLEACTWLTGRVLLIMFTARAFGRLLVQYRIPEIVANALLAMTSNVYIILALVIIFLIFVGMFMETLATIMILTPVLLPVMVKLGVDPIHFGIILVCCCEIGFETPPLGENLFIASGIANTSIEDISLKAIPFLDRGNFGGVLDRLRAGDFSVAAETARILKIIGMSIPALIYSGLVILVAGIIRGYSGFGFSMIAVISLSLVMPPTEIVPVILVLEVIASMWLLPRICRQIHWKSISWLSIGVLPGTLRGLSVGQCRNQTHASGYRNSGIRPGSVSVEPGFL